MEVPSRDSNRFPSVCELIAFRVRRLTFGVRKPVSPRRGVFGAARCIDTSANLERIFRGRRVFLAVEDCRQRLAYRRVWRSRQENRADANLSWQFKRTSVIIPACRSKGFPTVSRQIGVWIAWSPAALPVDVQPLGTSQRQMLRLVARSNPTRRRESVRSVGSVQPSLTMFAARFCRT